MKVNSRKSQSNENMSNKMPEAYSGGGWKVVARDKALNQCPGTCTQLLSGARRVLCLSLASLFCSALVSQAQMPMPLAAPSQSEPCGLGGDDVDSPALERLGIQQLLKLARLGSTTVLYSHNNKFSVDAWKELARTFKARGFGLVVEWRSQEIHLWDDEGDSLEKRKVSIHAGHFAELVDANLLLLVHEPVLSNLNLPPRNGSDTPVAAKGFEYDFQETNPAKEKASERTRSELGRTWAGLAQRAHSRGNRLVLKINSNRFSEADMLDILQKGGNVELNIAGATRYDARASRGAGTPTGYDKVKGFLRTVKNHNLDRRFVVRYNNKSLEDFLLEPKGIRPKSEAQAAK